MSIALLLMPPAIVLGRRFKLGVRPRLFRRSRVRISNLGGIALAVSALAATGFAVGMPSYPVVILGALAMLLLGHVDDRRKYKGGLPAWLRIVVGILTASLVWYGGLRPEVTGSPLLDAALVVFFLVATTNGINLLDNMDGVAGSTAFTIALAIAGMSLISGQTMLAGIAAAVAGATLGFLVFNFRRARIYLGDAGSLFLGFVLGGFALSLETALVEPWGFVMAITLFAVPAIDISVRQISRWLAGKSLRDIHGGLDHLSHRLVRAGLTTEGAALLHALVSAMAGATAIASARSNRPTLMGWALILSVGLGLMMMQVGRRHRIKKRWSRRVATAVLIGVGGALLVAIPPVLATLHHLENARGALASGVRSAQGFRAADAQRAFEVAESEARLAERAIRSPLAFGVKLLPIVRQNLDALEDIASGTAFLSFGAQQATDALAFFAAEGETPKMSLVQGRIDLDPWIKAAPRLKSAAASARIGLDRINTRRSFLVPPVSRVKELLHEGAIQAHGRLETGANLAELLPEALGGNGPRRWFLAIQNGAEMRATGGLIGAFGILRADGGQITLERMDADRNLPKISQAADANPEFLARYERFAVNSLWTNVNMTPDFPTSSRMILDLWERSTGEKLDGVIGIDAIGMAGLVEAVGPIRVEGIPETIDSKNFVNFTLGDAYALYPVRAERQDILVGTAKAAWQKVLSGQHSEGSKLVQKLATAASGKHLLVWGPKNSQKFSEMGLSGKIASPAESDYLMVVGQNAAANKVDLYSKRTISYEVDLRGRAKGNLEVQMKNEAPKSGLPAYVIGREVLNGVRGFNRSYISVYRSVQGLLGATIDGEPSGMESHSEGGLSVFSNFLVAKPGGTSTLTMDLMVPEQTVGAYTLFVQKQPTINNDLFQLEVTLPDGASPIELGEEFERRGQKIIWRGELDSEKSFTIRYGNTPVQRLENLFAFAR